MHGYKAAVGAVALLSALGAACPAWCGQEHALPPIENPIINKELKKVFQKHIVEEKDVDLAWGSMLALYEALDRELARRLNQLDPHKMEDHAILSSFVGMSRMSNRYASTKALVRLVGYHPINASLVPQRGGDAPEDGCPAVDVLLDDRPPWMVRMAILEFLEEGGLSSLKESDRTILARVWMLSQKSPAPSWREWKKKHDPARLRQAKEEIIASLREDKQRTLGSSAKPREKAKRIQAFIDLIARTPYTAAEVKEDKPGGGTEKKKP